MSDLPNPVDPTVSTDEPDYAPGTTATVTATNFGVGDELQFQVTVIDPATGLPLSGFDAADVTWTAYEAAAADGSGFVQTSLAITDAYANRTIQLTVTDLTTGQTASTTFTDGGGVGVKFAQWANQKP